MQRWLIAALTVLAAGSEVKAQCPSAGSSCTTCHARDATLEVAPWHSQHAFGDLCAFCHGGDPDATEMADAHLGLHGPLADVKTTCGGCHGDDLAARVASWGDLSVTAPTASAATTGSAAPVDSVDGALALLAIALAVGIALALRPRGRSARLAAALDPRAKRWSPYVAGAGLGLVVAFSEAILGKPIAVSGAFDRLAANVGGALFPDAPYWRFEMSGAVSWHVWLVVGLLGGAVLSAILSGEARWRWLPDDGWVPRYGPSRWRRLAVAFVGAALVQIGADIAGGCTSGLAISGGVALAPGAFVFMAGMFLSGLPTAFLLFHRARPRD